MDRIRAIQWPAYAVGALLIITPMIDSVLSTWPVRPGEATWRFGAAGLFSRALMTPLLGALVLMATSLLLGHRRVTRSLAILGAIVAAALPAMLLFFLLDAIQMRGQVNPEALRAFDIATLVAAAKYLVASGIAIIFAVAGWKASALMAGRQPVHRTAGLMREPAGGTAAMSS